MSGKVASRGLRRNNRPPAGEGGYMVDAQVLERMATL